MVAAAVHVAWKGALNHRRRTHTICPLAGWVMAMSNHTTRLYHKPYPPSPRSPLPLTLLPSGLKQSLGRALLLKSKNLSP